MPQFFDLIQTFQSIGSVSGDETALAERIAALARPYADEVSTDRLGNLIVRKRGAGPKVMSCAHMDTAGLLVTHVQDDGFVRFAVVGDPSPRDLINAPVVFKNGTRGVIAFEEKTDPKDLKPSHGYIDIGADDRAQAEKAVGVGDRARYAAQPFEANGKIVSPHLDDYAGCAVLLKTLAGLSDTGYDLYFVFTAQGQTGWRGAQTAAFAIEPDWALAVDAVGAVDVPACKRKNGCRLGSGAAIKLMDPSVACHPTVVGLLEEQARAAGIPYQLEASDTGRTDAGAVALSRGGVPTSGVSIPVRYLRTPSETAATSDMEACAALLSAVLEKRS